MTDGDRDKATIAAALPLAYKSEAILEWTINCGIIKGKRISKKELGETLGMDLKEVNEELEKMQALSAKSFEKRDIARQQIMSVVERLMNQLQSDRSRAVLHADILEAELEKTQKLLEDLGKLPETSATQRNAKRQEIGRYLNHFRELSRDKIESIRTLFESTESITRFLGLFTGGRPNGKGEMGGGLRSVLDGGSEAPEGQDWVDHKKAIKILEDNQAGILPTQSVDLNSGPRNPSAGFEEFREPEEK